MMRAIALSFAQLRDPPVWRVLLASLAITLALFVAAGIAIGWALDGSDPCALISSRSCPIGAAGGGIAATLLVLAAMWLLFPAVAIGITSLFADTVVEAVEARHYPAAAASARPVGWGTAARLGLASAGRLIGYNLVALPFYLALLLTAVGPFILFLIVNAIALGRDLDDMVAVRHLDSAGRKARLPATRGRRALTGLVTTGLFLVPGLNLLAPVIGAALATHRFHGRTV